MIPDVPSLFWAVLFHLSHIKDKYARLSLRYALPNGLKNFVLASETRNSVCLLRMDAILAQTGHEAGRDVSAVIGCRALTDFDRQVVIVKRK